MSTHSDSLSERTRWNLPWKYDEEFEAVLHDGILDDIVHGDPENADGCLICAVWRDHYQLSKRVAHPSLAEARQAQHRAVQRSFESRVETLDREHDEMVQEAAALQRELEQIQMEIEEVRKDQVRIINSNMERKC